VFAIGRAFGGETLACTNVLRGVGDTWKVIHHHADNKLIARADELASED
jgi:hypothetical protein